MLISKSGRHFLSAAQIIFPSGSPPEPSDLLNEQSKWVALSLPVSYAFWFCSHQLKPQLTQRGTKSGHIVSEKYIKAFLEDFDHTYRYIFAESQPLSNHSSSNLSTNTVTRSKFHNPLKTTWKSKLYFLVGLGTSDSNHTDNLLPA